MELSPQGPCRLLGISSVVMSAYEDATRDARQFASIGNQLSAQNLEFQRIGEQIGRQLLASQAGLSAQKDLARVAARMVEPMQKAVAEVAKTIQAPLMMESAKVVASFQESMGKLVVDFPRIADLVALNLPAIQDFRPMLEQLESIRLPTALVAPELLATFRVRANEALDQVAGPEGAALIEAMQSLEAIEDAAEVAPKRDARSNVFLVLGVLAIAVPLLANQREILETAFADAAFIGGALAHVWQYAAALLLILLGYGATRRGG